MENNNKTLTLYAIFKLSKKGSTFTNSVISDGGYSLDLACQDLYLDENAAKEKIQELPSWELYTILPFYRHTDD